MDVTAFLQDRTRFIRNFYERAGAIFRETMCKIEAEEQPFESPYSEDAEPPFLTEWLEADTALDVLGRSCISMLSASLKLYFETWEGQLGITWDPGERKKALKNGFLEGYKSCFAGVLGLVWAECPADLDIIEQVTLARNRDQHPDSITRMSVVYTPSDKQKHAHLFFATDAERLVNSEPETAEVSWLNPSVRVNKESLYKAIDEVEKLAQWLECKIRKIKYGR